MALTTDTKTYPDSGADRTYAPDTTGVKINVDANGGTVTLASVTRDSGGNEVFLDFQVYDADGSFALDVANMRIRATATGGAAYEILGG